MRDHSQTKFGAADELELRKWTTQLGIERVARIAAILTDAGGKPGQPRKPESLMLLKIAQLKRKYPDRRLHDLVQEVARESRLGRAKSIMPESLVSILERDFRRYRHGLLWFADNSSMPSAQEIFEDTRKPLSVGERRARTRLLELLPGAIDLYDLLLAEAGKAKRLIKRLGRERVEPVIEEAIRRRLASPSNLGTDHAVGIPRSLFELVEPELSAVLKRESKHRQATRVGR